MLTRYLSLGRGLAVTAQARDTGQRFYNLIFNQEVAAAPITSKVFFLIAFLEEASLVIQYNITYNIIIIQCINYAI